jgi:ribosome-associated protein
MADAPSTRTNQRGETIARQTKAQTAAKKAVKKVAKKTPRNAAKKAAKKVAKRTRANDPELLARSRELLALVQASLDDDKAEEVAVIELAGKSDIADFMVVASGRSSRQVGAMAHHLREKLKGAGVTGISVEGAARADWVLIDGGDIIVHLFRPEVRAFYALEKMWGEEFSAERESVAGSSG